MEKYDFEIPPHLAASREHRQQHAELGILTKIILGAITIGLGIYIGNVLYTQYLAYEASQALQQFSEQVANETRQAQARMQANAELARQHELAIERERTRQKQLEIDYRQAQVDRQLADQEQAREKEQAWSKYYKAPAFCDDTSRPAVMVDCGNRYIRARHAFEAYWAMKQSSSGRLNIE